ncbi:MAG: signal peptidase I [Bacteroidales bacterium]|nr:signal peptidase I [Bacteroidales bacterium]
MADILRQFIQIMTLLLCLFLVVRTVGVEPFGVPTGSMAEALIGNHRESICPRCQYPVRVGQPASRGRFVDFGACRCPNCDGHVDLTQAPELPGDRLLVDKTAFEWRSPRRWEIAVFRCSADLDKPYVKRTVGLPGERIQIIDGDIYANGELARKTWEQIRETRIPFFDLNYAPITDGWRSRWLVEPIAADPNRIIPWRLTPGQPVDADILQDGSLHLDATQAPIGLTYRHWQWDRQDTDPVRDWLHYNGPAPSTGRTRPIAVVAPAVHDFCLECDLEIHAGAGSIAFRLGDGGDYATVEIPIQSQQATTLQAIEERALGEPVEPISHSVHGFELEAGRSYHVEFAFVDRRITLAVDGQVIVPPLDLPPRDRRGGVRQPLQLGVRGAHVAIHNLKLYHDIHYRSEGRHAVDRPHQLAQNEYFMLGDNSADSHDSREWPEPGVAESDFIGKPFLIHQPMRLARVRINGRDRLFQFIDWSRFRWVR